MTIDPKDRHEKEDAFLDPALLRAGRFHRQVVVDRPDKTGRIAILGVHMKPITLAPGIDAAKIAGLTPGVTGAELAHRCIETRHNEKIKVLKGIAAAGVGISIFVWIVVLTIETSRFLQAMEFS